MILFSKKWIEVMKSDSKDIGTKDFYFK